VLRIGDVTQVLCNNRHHSCRNWRQIKIKKNSTNLIAINTAVTSGFMSSSNIS